jgi:hypothetical protein
VTFITLCRGYRAKKSVPQPTYRGDRDETTRDRCWPARLDGRDAHAGGGEGIRARSEALAQLLHELPASDPAGVSVVVGVFAVSEPVLVIVAVPQPEQLTDRHGDGGRAGSGQPELE